MSDDRAGFDRWLLQFLGERNLSAVTLARKIDVELGDIQDWLRNLSAPSAVQAIALANALQVPLSRIPLPRDRSAW